MKTFTSELEFLPHVIGIQAIYCVDLEDGDKLFNGFVLGFFGLQWSIGYNKDKI